MKTLHSLVDDFLGIVLKRARTIYRALPLNPQMRNAVGNFIHRYAPWILGASSGRPDILRPAEVAEDGWRSTGRRGTTDGGPNPVVSIIIPIHDGCEDVPRCLKSIADHACSVPYEVIVMCDESSRDSVEPLQSTQGIRVLTNSARLGFTRTCNRGAQEAKSDYVCFLSPYAEVTDHWLDELVRTFSEIPGTGLVGSKLIRPDGLLHEAGGILWQNGNAQGLGRGEDMMLPMYNHAREIDYCSMASMVIPRPLFESLGGLDTHYAPASCEHQDLALKIRSMGYHVIYQPCSAVVHHQQSAEDGARNAHAEKLCNRWKTMLADHRMPSEDVDGVKDRGFKHRALILGRSIPMPDQDTDSVAAINVMYHLRSMGFQITFLLAGHALDAPERAKPLQRTGIEVLHHPYCGSVEQHLKEHGGRYDVVLAWPVDGAEDTLAPVREHVHHAKIISRNVWGADISWEVLKQILEEIGIEGIERGHRPLKLWSPWDHKDDVRSNRAIKNPSTTTELQRTSPRGYMSPTGKNELISHINMLGEIAWHSLTTDPTIVERSRAHAEVLRPIIDGMSRELSGQRPVRILEVAAYALITGYELQSSHDVEVVLTDISKDTLALGKKVALEHYSEDVVSRVHRLAIDYHQIPYDDGTFDIVFIAAAIHHTWNWRTVLNELIRVTGSGGVVVLHDEPCLREFCLYGFRTSREYNPSKPEQALLDMGLLHTFGEPYLGSYSESLFNMIENETIPLDRLISYLKIHGDIAGLDFAHVIGEFENALLEMREHGGPDELSAEIEQRLMRGIEEISTMPDHVYPPLPVPDQEELSSFSARLSRRIHSTLELEGDDEKRSVELAKIFGAAVKIQLRKEGNLSLAKSELGLDRFKTTGHDVQEAYPEALNNLLSRGQNIAPNIQLDSDDVLHKFFPGHKWSIHPPQDGSHRCIAPTDAGNFVFIGDVSKFDKVGISIRVYTGYQGHPYRLILLINDQAVKHYDVYVDDSLLFTHITDATKEDLYFGLRIAPVPGLASVVSTPSDMGIINIGTMLVLGIEDKEGDGDLLHHTISATNKQEYHEYLANSHSPELVEYPEDIVQTIHLKNTDVDGFCIPCESRVPFRVYTEFDGAHKADREAHFGESMICPQCGLNSKLRLMAALIRQHVSQHAGNKLCVLGPTPSFHRWLRAELDVRDLTILGLVEAINPDWTLHENMPESSTLASESIDLVVGIGDNLQKLSAAEIFRILKPDGRLLAPLSGPSGLEEDSVRKLNSTTESDSSAPDDFSWNYLDMLREAGFEDVCIQLYASAGYGHIGTANTILSANKPRAAE